MLVAKTAGSQPPPDAPRHERPAVIDKMESRDRDRKGRSPSRDGREDSRDRKMEKKEKKEKRSRPGRSRSRSRSRSSPRDRRDRDGGSTAAAPGAAKRKRRAMWDVGADGQKATAAPAVTPVAATTNSLLMLQEQALLTRKVRCLHVGNVTGSVTAEIMRAFINGAMHKENMAAAPGDVVIRIDPLPEKCACFLEFRSPIECSNALGLSGIELQGRQLRISRTRDYEPCPPHLLNVVIPPGLPPPGTAMQKAIASRNAGVSAGYGARPDLAGSTVKQDGMTFDGFAWTKSGQPRTRDSRPAEERPSNALELSRCARRVYVGNLPPTELLDNEALKGFFTRSMTERGLHDMSKVAAYTPLLTRHTPHRMRATCRLVAGWLHAGWSDHITPTASLHPLRTGRASLPSPPPRWGLASARWSSACTGMPRASGPSSSSARWQRRPPA